MIYMRSPLQKEKQVRADDPGFHIFGGEVVIKRWSPQLESTLRSTGIGELRISQWDLGGLAQFAAFRDQLTRIFIECEIADASAIGELHRLKTLSMRGGASQINFAGLSSLERLSILADVPEFGNLATCRSLQFLSLTDCGLQDLRPLSGLSGLTDFELSEAPLRSLTGVAGMRGLKRISLLQLPLEQIDELSAAPLLQEVALGFLPRLKSVAGLTGLPQLTTVIIYSCRNIKDLDGLGRIAGLTTLEVMNVPVSSVEFIGRLTNLRTLRLESTGSIPSLSFLRGLNRLETFFPANNTKIVDGDLSILLELPALKEVRYTERRHYRPRRDKVQAAISARQPPSARPELP